jgi:primase-like protein
MSCHAAGVEREAFIDWSTSDPAYADDGDEIAERWESFRADGGITGRALFVEARMVEIDRYLKGRDNTTHNTLPWEVPLGGRTSFQPTRNPKHRVRGLMRMIESAEGVAREQALFNVACVMREMIAEGALRPKVALSLLESACQINRLWRDDRAACRRAIASAFLTVETKLREEQSDGEAA